MEERSVYTPDTLHCGTALHCGVTLHCSALSGPPCSLQHNIWNVYLRLQKNEAHCSAAGAVVKQVLAGEMVDTFKACLVMLIGGSALSGRASHPCC